MRTLVFASSLIASEAWAAEVQQCQSVIRGVTYDVRLVQEGGEEPVRREMSVAVSTGERTTGRATMYRSNTRWFLSTGTGGYKLGKDGTRWSLCLGANGTDCAACVAEQPLASSYTGIYSFVVQNGLRIDIYFDGRFFQGLGELVAAPEVVVRQGSTVVASGRGVTVAGRSDDLLRLYTGGGSDEYYDIQVSGGVVRLPGSSQWLSAELTTADGSFAGYGSVIESLCERPSMRATLYQRGGRHYIDFRYTELAGHDPVAFAAPAIEKERGEWRALDVIISEGQLCTALDGCARCD